MTAAFGFAPMIPVWSLVALSVVALLLVGFALVRRARGAAGRALALTLLVLVLANPRFVSEEREAQPDVVFAVLDGSPSQTVGERGKQADDALAALQERLADEPGLELRVVRAGGAPAGTGVAPPDGTRLFQPLAQALAEVPGARTSAIVLLTDGQVHDVPAAGELGIDAPVHVLLTGARDEVDRRLVIDQAPAYGLVGKEIAVEYRVLDAPAATGQPVRVTVRVNGRDVAEQMVTAGQPQSATVTLERAGTTVVELEAETRSGELTPLNNRTAVTVNAVRDRLRVLLISGQPHAGERMWRNLLKSDPAVDLVHFTILRPPEKDDLTPLRDLALIVFPIHELFEVKLHEFDLVIFDRHMVRDVLPASYMRNIVTYVEEGGAMLTAVGPEFAGARSLYNTPLGQLMPGRPTGALVEEAYRPELTELGRRHPVTSTLYAMQSARRPWGEWFRQVDVAAERGTTVMAGPGERPLLLLDRFGKGRVAELTSDHIWLWARGYEGGGPQVELLRRLAHWLMQEPELEEENLTAHFDGGRISIVRRTLSDQAAEVTVTAPSGETETVVLAPATPGLFTAGVVAREAGLYRIDDGTLSTLVAAGAVNPLEFSDPRASETKLSGLVQASGGGIFWLEDGNPEVRRVRTGRDTAGRGWMGLPRTESYRIVGLDFLPLLPGFLVLFLVGGALALAWWREGR